MYYQVPYLHNLTGLKQFTLPYVFRVNFFSSLMETSLEELVATTTTFANINKRKKFFLNSV